MKSIQKCIYGLTTWFLTSFLLFSETAQKTAEHAQEKSPTLWDFLTFPRFITKFYVMLFIGLTAFFLLKLKGMKQGVKLAILVISTFLFGILGNITTVFAMHPSPICAATKSILYGFGMPLIIMVAVIFILTLIGPKLFCGWVCPVGALQELITMLTGKLGIKTCKPSIRIAHTVRLIIFLGFVFLSGTAIINTAFEGNVYAVSLYDYFNPFHGFEFGADENLSGYIIHYGPLLLTIIFAFKLYRPFCHYVCPVGLFTHWIEQIAIFRIRFNKPTCTDCGICLEKTPCKAVPEILKQAAIRPDCFSCNDCIRTCPQKSFDIGIK